ncbi:MAG: NADPH:quinone reductase [Bradyrhizobium sp.]|nr:NADPH:quinone reductase [Bradyrhizobium sp.]
MTRTVLFDRLGGPEVLTLVDAVPPPPPAAGEVLVEMRAIGVNRSDAAFRAGKYLIQAATPCSLGIEGTGVVRAVGDDVTRWAIGQRVSVLPAFPQGGRYATYAALALFPETSLIPAPDGLDDVRAAALWISYLTAWGALVELGSLGDGDFVLISAASSSVGLAAIQIANARGAVPIATTRGPGKVRALHEAGAAHVVVTDQEDVPAAVRTITGPQGLRIAFDSVAGRFAEALVACMAEEGTIFFYGGLSDEPTMFDRRPIIGRGISFTGYTVGQILRRQDRMGRGIAFVLDGLARGLLAPRVDRTFPLEAVVEAHRYMESNAQMGKIILTV